MDRRGSNVSIASISSHNSNDHFHVSFDGPQTTPLPSAMEKGFYRQVPYRFFTNQTETDTCKLEKITNLFPDMKATIELELFKINNLTRTIDRLSRVYSILTALDIRDDTLHLFLGPYHLSLGPALFAALHFKNASAALLVASRPDSVTGSTNQRRKRRRDAVLRRFRRAVRKLTLVKSIIDQLRPASVLTPYNQYELYTHGIYDLVLAGRIQDSQAMFTSETFQDQMESAASTNPSGDRNPLLASNFIKINNLLNLLSTSQPQQQPQSQLEINAAATSGKLMRAKSNESVAHTSNSDQSDGLVDSSAMCCAHHGNPAPFVMFPVPQAPSPQPSQFFSAGTRSRNNSTVNSLKTPSILSRQSTVNSLPDSSAGDASSSDPPSSTSVFTSPVSNQVDIELDTPKNSLVPYPTASSPDSSSPLPSNTNDEDALINRISSLLTSHLLSRQSATTTMITSTTTHEHETNSNLSDSAISLSTGGTTPGTGGVVISNQSSPSLVTSDFDKLLQRIKTAVDNRLSIEASSHRRMHRPTNSRRDRPFSPQRTATLNRRQHLLALHAVSCHEAHPDDYDTEHTASANSKHKLDRTYKSQSFDASNLNNHDVTTTTPPVEPTHSNHQMTTFEFNSKSVQTDPRIRHARSKLVETLQAYITVVNRYREHLFQQYSQSNVYYEQHYTNMPELQQYEYRDLINVRKEILNRFEWVINEIEQTIENLQSRRVSVADAQQRIDRPLVKEVIESSLNADLPPVDAPQTSRTDRQRPMPSEDEWRLYARDLQDTKEDLYFIDSLVHRGISKIDRLVTFTNLYS